MEFTVADDDWKSESAYRKGEVLFFGGDMFAHIWFWTPYCQSCYIFGRGALPPWTSQQGRCPCTPPGPRRPLDPGLFPFFSKFQSVTHVARASTMTQMTKQVRSQVPLTLRLLWFVCGHNYIGHISLHTETGATHGAMVCTSAFLASTCLQCWSAGSNLSWGLNFLALMCGIFWS